MNESPIFSRTYDLLLWLLPQTTKFPRVHRFGLGERVTRWALDLHETLIAAGLASGPARQEQLRWADVVLAQLRQQLRLCHDLALWGDGAYEHSARMVTEIGRLLGGWLKTAR